MADPGGQGLANLLEPWMHIFDQLDDLVVTRLDVGADALEPGGADFEVGNADGVLVGHPQGKMACCLRDKIHVAGQAFQSVAKESCVIRVLIVHKSPHALNYEIMCRARQIRLDALLYRKTVTRRRHALGRGFVPCFGLARCCIEAGSKAAQVGFGRLAAAENGGLERAAREGQRTAGRERSEHHRADHAPGAV
ncbi:MAG: hypothetical protein U0987_19330, partial [Afipia sp.]|nr:hypothetical protein [Afipia sp.]